MNKSEIVREVATNLGLSINLIEDVVEEMFQTMIDCLQDGDDVVITGFGTFKVKLRAERTARNISTGEEIKVPPMKATVFKPSKALKDLVK